MRIQQQQHVAATSVPVTGYIACLVKSSASATNVTFSSQSFTHSNNQRIPTALSERYLS